MRSIRKSPFISPPPSRFPFQDNIEEQNSLFDSEWLEWGERRERRRKNKTLEVGEVVGTKPFNACHSNNRKTILAQILGFWTFWGEVKHFVLFKHFYNERKKMIRCYFSFASSQSRSVPTVMSCVSFLRLLPTLVSLFCDEPLSVSFGRRRCRRRRRRCVVLNRQSVWSVATREEEEEVRGRGSSFKKLPTSERPDFHPLLPKQLSFSPLKGSIQFDVVWDEWVRDVAEKPSCRRRCRRRRRRGTTTVEAESKVDGESLPRVRS